MDRFIDFMFGVMLFFGTLAILALIGIVVTMTWIAVDDYKNNEYTDKSEITIIQKEVVE